MTETKNGKTEAPPHTIVNKITTEIERTKRTIYRTNIEKVFKKTKTKIMLHPLIKKTAKKLYSGKYKGLFILLDIKQNSISFKNVNNVVFSYQVGTEIENYFNLFTGCGIFSAGYVNTGTILTPTFESEYSKLGLIETAEFRPFHKQATDNPDYIKRTALQITLN